MTDEKEELLARYLKEWRGTYTTAARFTNGIEKPERRRKSARLWYTAHQFRCDHTPRCRSLADFWKTYRNPAMQWMRNKLKDGRSIHHLAFSQAWYKGVKNRKWAPVSYRQLCLVPKQLVHQEPGLLLLRLYAQTDLVFYADTPVPDLSGQDDRAYRLVQRRAGWRLDF